jgi:hypothetical protein
MMTLNGAEAAPEITPAVAQGRTIGLTSDLVTPPETAHCSQTAGRVRTWWWSPRKHDLGSRGPDEQERRGLVRGLRSSGEASLGSHW